MSSTNRSDERKKHISDYYITPVSSIIDFFNAFHNDINIINGIIGIILDPCSGGISPNYSYAYENDVMSYPTAIKKTLYLRPRVIDTIDIRPDSRADIKADYLKYEVKKNYYNIIITNPPFNIALDIIKKALSDVRSGGLVIMLLRLNFFGSKARKQFWLENTPVYTYVHSKRMYFTIKDTNRIEYMHCVWIKGVNPEFTKLRVI